MAVVSEALFEVPAGDGVLAGHRGGEGPPALVLHGGPAVADYTEGEEAGENLRRGLTTAERVRVDEVEELRRQGEATEDDLQERFMLLWPQYFADPAGVRQVPPRIGPECSRDTNASISEHFARGTLVNGLPGVRLPALFVHGALDPIPLWSVERTAALVPGARLETIPDCGHFPWWEQPDETRRLAGQLLPWEP
jgi:pimeloyl-ACP methyl ester carboxylesterase